MILSSNTNNSIKNNTIDDWIWFYYNKGFSIIPIKSNDKKPNIVIEETGKGYTLKGKVIRPAIVIVSKPKSSSVNSDEDKSQEGAWLKGAWPPNFPKKT